jgi:hypothetical protein
MLRAGDLPPDQRSTLPADQGYARIAVDCTLTGCSRVPTPSSLALYKRSPSRGRTRKLLQSSERTARHSDPVDLHSDSKPPRHE